MTHDLKLKILQNYMYVTVQWVINFSLHSTHADTLYTGPA